MSFAVKCQCGKVFNVKDEFLNRQVECQVCHAVFTATPEAAAPEPPAVSSPSSNASAAAASGNFPCPFCAEPIPKGSVFCPLCGESLGGKLTPEQGAQLLAAASAQLDQYVRNPENLSSDDALRGRLFSTMSIVLGILLAISVAAIVAGGLMHRDSGMPLVVLGIIFGLIFIIAFPISWANDYRASHIHDAQKPEQAMRRYFLSCRSGRHLKAFACLAPSARNGSSAHAPKFEKIPSESPDCKITDWSSFREYCRTIFKGPGGYQRAVYLKKVKVEKQLPDGTAWVTAEFQFTSFSKWLYLLILINLLVCAVVVAVVTKREKKTIRKCLFRRGDRWYVAEADFEGALDKAAPAFAEA
ncbi:MAG: zinc ribbon domain-containing protein [Candidatus Brocadiia bacterium]|jgi:hypothetical protein